jgi:hypothetical protein
MGREATVVVHDNGIVTAVAIGAPQSVQRLQNEVDGLLRDMQRKYRNREKSLTLPRSAVDVAV